MADSIAKLAVVITGDASPLAKATGDAAQIVRKFDSDTSNAFANGVKGAKLFQAAIHGAEGSLRGLGHLAELSFGVAGPLLAIAGIAKATFEFAAAADELNVKLGASELDTWAGQWKRLTENVSTAVGIIGEPLAGAAKEASAAFADLAASFNEWMRPGITAELEAVAHAEERAKEHAKQQAIAKKAAEEAERKRAQAAKEAADAAEKERDAMTQWMHEQDRAADSIRKSVATPLEQLKDKFLELRQLFHDGFIDEETVGRAAEQAVDAFRKAKGELTRDTGTAAVNRFTTAGFSAVQSGQRELQRLEQIQKDQLAEAKKIADVDREIANILNARLAAPVVIGEGPPP